MARNAPVRDVRLTIGGVGLHYRDWGDVAAPPLLLLHGAFLHARTWDTFAVAMADQKPSHHQRPRARCCR